MSPSKLTLIWQAKSRTLVRRGLMSYDCDGPQELQP